jgi:hypothetical protein
MARDYIVDEVRRIREEQAAKYEFNLQTILAAAKKRQSRSTFKVVSFAQKSGHPTKSITRPPTKRAAGDV